MKLSFLSRAKSDSNSVLNRVRVRLEWKRRTFALSCATGDTQRDPFPVTRNQEIDDKQVGGGRGELGRERGDKERCGPGEGPGRLEGREWSR